MPGADEIARATARRVRIVELIAESVRDKGYPPSLSELAEKTGVSKPQVRKDLNLLEAEGVIERDAGEHRGLRIKSAV